MDRRTFLKTSLAVAASTGINTGQAGTHSEAVREISTEQLKGKPNVIFILSDQHNAKVMGHQGHSDVKTPNFDRMAKEGVRFDACITANPICTPSRVSFLSGQYCHNHGYYGLSGPNPNGLPTVLGYFRKAGYRTAAIGKIHCPQNWVENDCDVFHDTCGTSIGGQSKEYADYLKEKNLTDLEDHVALKEFGPKGVQAVDARASKVSYKDGQEGWSVQKAVEFMNSSKAQSRPFFLHLSFPKPHQCYTPAKEFWDLYDESKLTLPPNSGYDMSLKAPHLKNAAENWKNNDGWLLFEPKTFEAGRLRKLHGYLGNISHIDHAVGQVFDYLDKNGLSENTIVVYSSDHGDYACEHDIMEKAPGICSDAITRVPMVWRWPGHFKSGHIVKEVVETIDAAQTLCLLAGLEKLQTSDGCDLSKMLAGGTGDSRRTGLTEFAWSKSLRKGDWRLVAYPTEMFEKEFPKGFGELYNIKDDPWEMKNLYFDEKYADVVKTLQKELYEKLITTTRPATIHGSEVSAQTGPQFTEKYHHTVNADNKMHYDRIRDAANAGGYKNYQ